MTYINRRKGVKLSIEYMERFGGIHGDLCKESSNKHADLLWEGVCPKTKKPNKKREVKKWI